MIKILLEILTTIFTYSSNNKTLLQKMNNIDATIHSKNYNLKILTKLMHIQTKKQKCKFNKCQYEYKYVKTFN